MDRFGLPAAALDAAVGVLRRYPAIEGAQIFGSRAKGTHKRYSDVDIAIFHQADGGLAAQVSDALSDLDTIFTFDVLDYYRANAALRAHVDRVGQQFYARGGGPASRPV